MTRLENCFQTSDKYLIELLVLDCNTLNHLTMCGQMGSGLFKNSNVTYKIFAYKSYMYMYTNRIWY